MSKAVASDVRQRVVRAVEDGLAPAEVAEQFGVSRSSVKRWARKVHETGELEPKPRGGDRRSMLTSAVDPQILELCRQYPDISVDDIQVRLASEGVRISVSTVRRVLRRHGLTRRWIARKQFHAGQRHAA